MSWDGYGISISLARKTDRLAGRCWRTAGALAYCATRWHTPVTVRAAIRCLSCLSTLRKRLMPTLQQPDGVLSAAVSHSAVGDYRERDALPDIDQRVASALTMEVMLTPKLGLVDRANNGSHRDMDVALFQTSIQAISPGSGILPMPVISTLTHHSRSCCFRFDLSALPVNRRCCQRRKV